MPLYEYWCPQCKEESERMASIEERDVQQCATCEGILRQEIRSCADLAYERKFLTHRVGKEDIGLGVVIESRSHKKNVLKEKGLIEVPGGMFGHKKKGGL